MSVHDITSRIEELGRRVDRASVDGQGGGGDDGDVNERVAALEAIIPTLATKADIGDVRSDIKQGIIETHRWMIGTVVGLFVGFGGLFLAMSNALKPSAGASQPTVIVLPASISTAQPSASGTITVQPAK